MALGARRWRIVRALLASAIAMLIVGLLAGLGLAAIAGTSLAPQLYQTPPYDVSTYFAVALLSHNCDARCVVYSRIPRIDDGPVKRAAVRVGSPVRQPNQYDIERQQYG
jgi:hypothetical protein